MFNQYKCPFTYFCFSYVANTSIFAFNPGAPAFDIAGNLYISKFSSSTASNITPEGKVSTYASRFMATKGFIVFRDPE